MEATVTTITEYDDENVRSIAQLMAIPDDKKDIKWLQDALQNALILELATIPPYSCGLWSIVEKPLLPSLEPTPKTATSRMIREIIFDEMYHVGLVGNMLYAI
jgi:Ferritin-like